MLKVEEKRTAFPKLSKDAIIRNRVH